MIPAGFVAQERHEKGKNWYYTAKETASGQTVALLHCLSANSAGPTVPDEPGTFTIVDMDRIMDVCEATAESWKIMDAGYPGGAISNGSSASANIIIMPLHLYLTKGRPTRRQTIQHANGNLLDNRLANIQGVLHTKPKAERQPQARPLPDGLVQSDLPVYVVYSEDILRKKLAGGRIEEIPRSYFRVDGHPLQAAKSAGEPRMYRPEYEDVAVYYSSTKSKFKSAREKLEQARAYVELLDSIAETTGFYTVIKDDNRDTSADPDVAQSK